eukprot:365480-Chlamydomonas_euryale.AAC.21
MLTRSLLRAIHAATRRVNPSSAGEKEQRWRQKAEEGGSSRYAGEPPQTERWRRGAGGRAPAACEPADPARSAVPVRSAAAPAKSRMEADHMDGTNMPRAAPQLAAVHADQRAKAPSPLL